MQMDYLKTIIRTIAQAEAYLVVNYSLDILVKCFGLIIAQQEKIRRDKYILLMMHEAVCTNRVLAGYLSFVVCTYEAINRELEGEAAFQTFSNINH